MAPSNPLIPFYEGTGTDQRGRKLSEILAWDNGRLESCHDYIQVVFPLPERSGVSYSAPVIDEEVYKAFRERDELRAALRTAFERILKFYGLQMTGDQQLIVKEAGNFERQADNWVTGFSHNHLRITRIIRCLRVLGLEEEAKAFHEGLKVVNSTNGKPFSSTSTNYWQRAATRPLHLAPDDSDNNESSLRKRSFLLGAPRSGTT